jgi:hypothetical protein
MEIAIEPLAEARGSSDAPQLVFDAPHGEESPLRLAHGAEPNGGVHEARDGLGGLSLVDTHESVIGTGPGAT